MTTDGQDRIEQRIPAGADGFVDGYEVRFSKFLIALSDVHIADRAGKVGVDLLEQRVFDMTRPGPHEMRTFFGVPAAHWDRVSISVRPAGTALAGDVSLSDLDRMNEDRFSVYVEGTALTSSISYAFAWGFRTSVRYEDCVDPRDYPGVNVPSGGGVTAEFTIHGDHLFYDALLSEAPSLRFAPLAAADRDGDRQVTQEELRGVDLSTLPSDQYGTGGDPDVKDLAAFLESLTGTLVRFQGEGRCRPVRD